MTEGTSPVAAPEDEDSRRRPGELPGSRRATALAALRLLIVVRDDETGALAWACMFVFSLLAGNYLIRPVRDEMGIAGGTSHLPVLFAGTLAAMLLVWPLVSSRLGRRSGRPSFTPLFRSFQVSLLAFFVAFAMMPAGAQAWAARAFFVWASITNLLVVSIAWGSLAGRFTSDQAHRLFGFIAAGGTLGRSPARRSRACWRRGPGPPGCC